MSDRCPYCSELLAVTRRQVDCQDGVIVYLRATCLRCHKRIDSAGHGIDYAEAQRMADVEMDWRIQERRGTDPSAWEIPVGQERRPTRRRF